MSEGWKPRGLATRARSLQFIHLSTLLSRLAGRFSFQERRRRLGVTRVENLNKFDYLAAAYLAWTLAKGYRRGAGPELQALLSLVLVLALILGFGLFPSIRDSLGWLVERQPGVSPMPAFFLVTLGSLFVFLLLRRRLKELGEQAPARGRRKGALLGLLRGLLGVLLLVGLAPNLPFQGLRDTLGPSSLSGRLGTPIVEAVQRLAARIEGA